MIDSWVTTKLQTAWLTWSWGLTDRFTTRVASKWQTTGGKSYDVKDDLLNAKVKTIVWQKVWLLSSWKTFKSNHYQVRKILQVMNICVWLINHEVVWENKVIRCRILKQTVITRRHDPRSMTQKSHRCQVMEKQSWLQERMRTNYFSSSNFSRESDPFGISTLVRVTAKCWFSILQLNSEAWTL